MSDKPKGITVCAACLRSSCWLGEFVCDKARTAGTTKKTTEELAKLSLEHPRYWKEKSDER